MKLTGTITAFDSAGRKGIVKDSNGKTHLIQPGSFRKTVRLKTGEVVQFDSFNLFAGAVAMNVEPQPSLNQMFEHFQSDLPR
jgi:hypothetical protein